MSVEGSLATEPVVPQVDFSRSHPARVYRLAVGVSMMVSVAAMMRRWCLAVPASSASWQARPAS